MSSRELSAEELRKLANYLSQQANDLEMTLEAVKKVAVSSQEIADEAEMLSKMGENANYLANSVQKIIAHEMEKIKK
ncbi:hypothetical protein MK549_02510 [Streptococcus gallolyticus subsp. gallolyticus]|jgi:methyl-accepting chemotaxis protein|uniref:Uncharacterized protein n=1 Tax=Streptococcus gallolyticus TaxID=315405 RepID=A0A139QNR8_9STRE|nr:hypothetical protein [Streptococcus gallolyticus]AQP42808.1 hypothetical protein BTR42_09190 [Streptococcus gallolyticus subsp. gallolyticus DSM 16831]EFM28959.1 hypothetical protein HMPREF9352_1635 [Streptococcus gallolyticus subsp. gallolyticus TX20005]KXT72290.1 hypothetical protein SGADD02_00525 [Streptococcus gallolyticus]KXU04164.1 hypothetical protein SGADD03_01973 [Streptococcus gallolyticus]MCO7177467.1 hypothetical protein [Streptococcus gallolyticus]